MMVKKALATITVFCMLMPSTVMAAEKNSSDFPVHTKWETGLTEYQMEAERVLENMFEKIDNQDWKQFTDLMCEEKKLYFESYFSDASLTNGVKQVADIKLVDIYSLSTDEAEDDILYDEYLILNESKGVFPYICEAECTVSEENQFFYNGINYFLVVVAVEDGECKVVQFNRPSMELMNKKVKPKLDEQSSFYEDEIKGINVLDSAEKGLVINADDEIITDGFKIIKGGESEIMTLKSDLPIINHYSSYSYPTIITVLMNLNGGTSTQKVGFTDYMQHVLPYEWIPSWPTESLKAGAYCIKMVGIYRAVNPMDSAGGYNLSQKTQSYLPNSSTYATTNSAISSIKNKGMANSDGRLFFPDYKRGKSGVKGIKGGGEVKQYGTVVLANEGCKYDQILNYYYSGSKYSSRNLNFFGYNLGY